MEEKILQLIAEIAKKDVEVIKTGMDDTRLWNSLTGVEIIITLEDEFNIEYSDDDITEMKTPRKIIQITMEKINEA